MRRHMNGRNGWIWFLGTMIVIDATFDENEMLSRAFDRFRLKHPIIAHVFVISCALHLLRLIPARFDPWGNGAHISRRFYTWLMPMRDAVRNG